MLISDKRWAQLLGPPVVALIWLLVSSQILKRARAGGQIAGNRSKLNWYSTGVILLVLYCVWFHTELLSYRAAWSIVFLVVALAIGLKGGGTNDADGRTIWVRLLWAWLIANAAGLIVVSIFRYFGN